MTKSLRAVVIGAGFAGEGHTQALRSTGVDVVAMCARQPRVVQSVADRLQVPQASVDWRQTLQTIRPDIVALATPANLRAEVVDVATALSCHLYCDKPLATTAEEAGRLYRLVEHAGVKHAYAATMRCDPSVVWLGELVRSGAIGTLREIEYAFRFSFMSPLSPWTWWLDLASGGGSLNQLLPHTLGMLATITGGMVVRVVGEARPWRVRAPVVPDIHDFRVLFTGERNPTPEEAERLEWRTSDVDGGFSALLTTTSEGGEIPVSLLASALAVAPWPSSGWRLYGDEGTLVADGLFPPFDVYRVRDGTAEREPLPVPHRLVDAVPQLGGDSENQWGSLARDFVADVRGERHRPYLTFYDGWRYQEAIDAIRSGRGWSALPA
jgi:predicted dehydrogenase